MAMLNEMPTQLGQISRARDGVVPVTAVGFLDMARVGAVIERGGLQGFGFGHARRGRAAVSAARIEGVPKRFRTRFDSFTAFQLE
jgi:hypothetical protein